MSEPREVIARAIIGNNIRPYMSARDDADAILAALAAAGLAVLPVGEIERQRAALRFYINPEVYRAHPHGPAFDSRDLSFVARAALAEPRDE
jgi:hypothetical protein